MTWARLRTFVAVADTGSVRAAAARLSVTESAVSAALASLQVELGAALVERQGRGVRLTAAGQVYAGYARKILGLLEEGAAAAGRGSVAERGALRLGAVTTAAEYLLPGLLASFRRRFPDVQVTLEVGVRDRVQQLLADHSPRPGDRGPAPARSGDGHPGGAAQRPGRRGRPDATPGPGRHPVAAARAGFGHARDDAGAPGHPRDQAPHTVGGLARCRARVRDPRAGDRAGQPGRRRPPAVRRRAGHRPGARDPAAATMARGDRPGPDGRPLACSSPTCSTPRRRETSSSSPPARPGAGARSSDSTTTRRPARRSEDGGRARPYRRRLRRSP